MTRETWVACAVAVALGCSGLKDPDDRARGEVDGGDDASVGAGKDGGGEGGSGKPQAGSGGVSGSRAPGGSGGDAAGGSGGSGGTAGSEPVEPNDPPTVAIDFPIAGMTDRTSITVRGRVVDPDGDAISELRVHDELAVLGDDGSFTVDAPLPLGEHPLAVHVEDARGAVADIDATPIERVDYLFAGAADMVLDRANVRLIAVDEETDAIVTLSLDQNPLRWPIVRDSDSPTGRRSLALDSANDRVLVTEPRAGALAFIDLTTGDRTVVSDATHGSGPAFTPVGAVLDPTDSGRAFAIVDNSSVASSGVFAIDLASGNRSELVGSGQAITAPRAIAWDAPRNRLLVASAQSVIAVDPGSGARTVISRAGGAVPIGSGPDWLAVYRLQLDGDHALVSAPEMYFGRPCIFELDLITGDRTILAELALGHDPRLQTDTAIPFVLDDVSGDVYALDRIGRLVVASLIGGRREPFSDRLTALGPAFTKAGALALDPVGKRWIVADVSLHALFAVDVESGRRSVISDAVTGTGPAFGAPAGMVLDGNNARALVLDETQLFAVDLATGNRTVLASDPGGTSFAGARDLAVNVDGTHAYLVGCFGAGSCVSKLYDVNLASGGATAVTLTGVGGPLPWFYGIARDNSKLVIAADTKLLEVDPTNGATVVLADDATGTGTALDQMQSISIDETNRYAVVTQGVSYQDVLGIDLATGNRTVLMRTPEGSGPYPYSIRDAVLDRERDRVMLAVGDSGNDAGLLELGLAAQSRRLIRDQGRGEAYPLAPAADVERDRLYFAARDELDIEGGVDVLRLELATGERTVASSRNVNTAASLRSPWAIVPDGANDALLAMDSSFAGPPAVVNVGLADGERTVLSGRGIGPGTELAAPLDLALDSAHDRVLALDLGLNAVMAVDPATGARSILSGGIEGVGTAFTQVRALALDPAGNRAFVADQGTVVAVDLVSGDRSEFSGVAVGSGPDPFRMSALRLDAAGQRLLAIDAGTAYPALLAFALADGARSLLMTLPLRWGLSQAVFGSPFSYDDRRRIAYVGVTRALFAIDIASGQRVVVEGNGK